MKIGYVRVSSISQNEARQMNLMKSLEVEKIYMEKESGKNAERKELQNMLAFCREGDTIIVESISRISRNTKDLLDIIEILKNKGVEFISQKEKIDTTTPQGKFMLTIFGALSTLERESILERQREGIAIAKAEGKYKGKPPIMIDKEKFINECGKWRKGEITAVECMKRLGVKPNTFYRRVKEWKL